MINKNTIWQYDITETKQAWPRSDAAGNISIFIFSVVGRSVPFQALK